MSRQVSDYLSEINDHIFLPGLQREFVWNPRQIEELFDSLIRDYPIGAITEWRVRAANISDYNSYNFLRMYVADDYRPPDPVLAEYDLYNQEVEDKEPEILIIDGQQRLNSLYIGVEGGITVYNGGRGKPSDELQYWEGQRLCVDLFGHPEYDRDDTAGDYGFEFKSTGKFGGTDETGYTMTGDTRHLWMPVGELWNGGNDGSSGNSTVLEGRTLSEVVDEYVDTAELRADNETRYQLRSISMAVARDITSNVLQDDLETDSTNKDRSEIPEIFTRLNMEGSDPKPYQLLLSKLMSYWPYAEEEDERINPREVIQDWIDEFKQKFPEYEQEIDRKLFLRYTAYLVGTDLLRSNLSSIDEERMDEMRERWLYNEPVVAGRRFEWFRTSLEKAFQTVIESGIRSSVMNTMPIFALLGVFYYQNPDAEVSDANRESVFQFVARALLLNKYYQVLTYGKCRNWMRYLREWEPEPDEPIVFPGEELFESENISPSAEDIRRVVANARYESSPGEPVFTDTDVTAVLGLIEESYTQSTSTSIGDYSVDHIYPKSRAESVSESIGETIDLNRIGNLQLLPHEMNEEIKSDQWPHDWLDDLGNAEAERIQRVNQYPDIEPTPENAQAFIRAREEQITDYLIDKYVK